MPEGMDSVWSSAMFTKDSNDRVQETVCCQLPALVIPIMTSFLGAIILSSISGRWSVLAVKKDETVPKQFLAGAAFHEHEPSRLSH
jgi:hypothetical protein